MSERRYVVELTRVVTGSDLPAAAEEIARRLGLDVARVETLLKDRVGAVTKPVLADKADSIAQVFQEAGVSVAVYEARQEAGHQGEGTENGAQDERPATEATAAEPPTHASADPQPPAPDASPRPDDVDPDQQAAPRDDYEYEAPAPVLPPDLDRWDAYDPWPGMDPWRESALEPEPPVPGAEGGEAEAVDDLAADDEPGDRDVIDDWPLPPVQATSVVRPAVWQVEPEHGGRRPLRGYLLIALGVAVVLLFALQFVYRGAGSSGVTYEDGLAAYRDGDFVAARRAWSMAASDGSVRAEFMLGHLAQHGLGRPWSYREAAQRYSVAAEAGLAEAQLALAELYFEGLGVEPDPEAGLAWLSRAASSGHPPALLRQGEALLHGVGGRQDFEAALAAFIGAAESGSTKAADYVGFARHFGATSGMMVP